MLSLALVLTASLVYAVGKSILFHLYQFTPTENLPCQERKVIMITRPDLQTLGECQTMHEMRAGCKYQISYSQRMGCRLMVFYCEIYAAPPFHEHKEGVAQLPSPALLWLQLMIFSLPTSINCAENKEKGSRSVIVYCKIAFISHTNTKPYV